MNIELLRKIQQRILEHPDRFNMFHWIDYGLGGDGCGTTACIAGWACVLARNMQFGDALRALYKDACDIPPTARNHLGLTFDQARRLFQVVYWPYEYKIKYVQLRDVLYETKDASCRAKVNSRLARLAAKRIDLFIESKGAQ